MSSVDNYVEMGDFSWIISYFLINLSKNLWKSRSIVKNNFGNRPNWSIQSLGEMAFLNVMNCGILSEEKTDNGGTKYVGL